MLELQSKWWQPNGNVKAMTIDSVKNIMYLGGTFNYIGPEQSFATQINTGEPNYSSSNFPVINGAVYCSASDGNGGWYIGGTFTQVGDSIRKYLAHISNTGVVTNWNPNPTSSVSTPQIKSIVKQNQVVYVGGQFADIGGAARQSIAALDASTGLSTSWNAHLTTSSNVNVIKINNQTIYAGGNNITSETAIVALNINTGLFTSWAPKVGGFVNDIAIKNDTIIIGGTLYQINNSNCSNVAAIDAAGQMINWYMQVDNVVRAMALKDNLLVIGGDFTALNIQYPLKNRNHLARINMSTGLVDDWDPNVNERVVSMTIDNNNLFLTGAFTKIGTSFRYRIAALDFYTGVPTNWDFDADNVVNTVSFSNNSMFIGGYFSSIGGQDRNLIAAMDLLSGQTTDWNPITFGTSVSAIAVYNDFVYVGGEFYSMGGKQCENLAELNYSSNIATNFNIGARNSVGGAVVYALVVSNDNLYVGGSFVNIDGIPSTGRIAAINLLSKTLINTWKPNADGIVRCISVDGDIVYIGGSFANVGGQPRKGIAALDAYTGLATSWNPNTVNPNWYSNLNYISSIAVSPSAVFVAGQFPTFGNNLSRNNIASINKSSGLVTNWRTSGHNSPQTIKLVNNKIYVAGSLSGASTALDVYDTVNGLLLNSYQNIINNTIFDIQFYRNQLFVGGSFYQSFNIARKGLAVFNTCSSQYFPTIELPDNYICPGSKTVLRITNANSATTWKWYTNNCFGTPLANNGDNIEISPTANATTYYVKGSGGCVNTGCQSKTVYLKTPPFKPLLTNIDNTLTTDPVNDGTYQWFNCTDNTAIQGQTNASYKPLISGDYKVVLSKSECSSASDCISLLINPTTTSMNHVWGSTSIKVYPNPTNGTVRVDLGQELTDYKFSVMNSVGECVLTKKVFNGSTTELDLEKQPSGIYIITIEKSTGIESIKIIKQ